MLITPAEFARKILDFYQRHGRKDLPWQIDPTAYRVWVSEIMLQQTQVKTVIPYYTKFMQSFPTLTQLAAANIDQVLHHWQGLGYYSRARNLHRCAQILVAEHHGQFPDSVEGMVALPGIGRSTAGAILSLAKGQSTPILDGNVKRVLARVFMVEGWSGNSQVAKTLWALTEKYTPQENTAPFNQAMMDLGASFCSRSKPQCHACPLSDCCLANIHGKVAEFPFKKPRQTIPQRSALLELRINAGGQIQLEKRPPSGIWGGLWSLPELEKEPANLQLVEEFRHTFTHFHLLAKVVAGPSPSNKQVAENSALQWHNIQHLPQLALPTPVRKFLFTYFQLNE